MGVASEGQRDIVCPDLIWTLSSGRSPGLDKLGPQQATNFFGTSSSCVTTKVSNLWSTECLTAECIVQVWSTINR